MQHSNSSSENDSFNSNNQIANIEISHLIMSSKEIENRLNLASPDNTLRLFISPGDEFIYENLEGEKIIPKSRKPEDWQYNYMRKNISKISKYIDVRITEVFSRADADYVLVIHPNPQKDALSNNTLMVSHVSGAESPYHREKNADLVTHTNWSKAVQEEIFLHELGHLLGLEHPWDQDDGDFAVQNWFDNHAPTRMGYNDHLSGETGWYEDIDIKALQEIWGKKVLNNPVSSELERNNLYGFESIKDYDGNLHGYLGTSAPENVKSAYKYQGKLDVNNDGITEAIYTNKESGRWVTASIDPITGAFDYSRYGAGGTTRIVGIYQDPLVTAGLVEKDSPFDGSRTFINDLKLDNLILKTVGDFDSDGYQEVYWSKVDNSAYLRAVMHADGNIQYANYQNLDQMTNYLTGNGFADTVALIA